MLMSCNMVRGVEYVDVLMVKEVCQCVTLYRYDEAEDLYDSVLESHPSCSAVWKRKVAVLKAQNKMQEAIDELSKLLHM